MGQLSSWRCMLAHPWPSPAMPTVFFLRSDYIFATHSLLFQKHAKDAADKDKATYLLINIEGSVEAAEGFKTKHSLEAVTHIVGQPAGDYCLQYIPHHCVISNDGIVVMNYDSPSRDYMSHC